MDSAGSCSDALPLTDVSQDDFLANQKKLPSSSSIEEHDSLQQHSLMPTNADGVIVAMPVAYKKANEDTIIYIESSRKSRKKTKAYAYDTTMWDFERRARKDGKKFDNKMQDMRKLLQARYTYFPQSKQNVYIHKTENFQCRSLQEVERYEKNGERPSEYNRKKKQLKENGEAPNENNDRENKKRERESEEPEQTAVEKFLADSSYNLLHWFDEVKKHQSKGTTSGASNTSISEKD